MSWNNPDDPVTPWPIHGGCCEHTKKEVMKDLQEKLKDLDVKGSSTGDIVTALKRIKPILFWAMMFVLPFVGTADVTPVYLEHWQVKGDVKVMTNIAEWADNHVPTEYLKTANKSDDGKTLYITNATGQGLSFSGGTFIDDYTTTGAVKDIIKSEVNTNYLSLAGGTISGSLYIGKGKGEVWSFDDGGSYEMKVAPFRTGFIFYIGESQTNMTAWSDRSYNFEEIQTVTSVNMLFDGEPWMVVATRTFLPATEYELQLNGENVLTGKASTNDAPVLTEQILSLAEGKGGSLTPSDVKNIVTQEELSATWMISGKDYESNVSYVIEEAIPNDEFDYFEYAITTNGLDAAAITSGVRKIAIDWSDTNNFFIIGEPMNLLSRRYRQNVLGLVSTNMLNEYIDSANTNTLAAVAALAAEVNGMNSDFPTGTAGTWGGLLLAVLAALAALKKRFTNTTVVIGKDASATGVDMGEGGVITRTGNIVTHTFLTNGTFKAPSGVKNLKAVVIGGGGGGAAGTTAAQTYLFGGGGGGGGGVAIAENPPFVAGSQYVVTVGAAGMGAANTSASATSGTESSIAGQGVEITAGGGTKGGNTNTNKSVGGAGGNSGRVSINGVVTEGNSGATKTNGNLTGGGGAGAGAGVATDVSHGGNGILATVMVYDGYSYVPLTAMFGAGGGGGAKNAASGVTDGGLDGGGNAGVVASNGTNGRNYGSGGGSGLGWDKAGGNGYQGVVEISYDVSELTAVGIALGNEAKSTAPHAVQIGEGTNNTAWSFKFHDTTVVDPTGKIPVGTLPTIPAEKLPIAGKTFDMATGDMAYVYAMLRLMAEGLGATVTNVPTVTVSASVSDATMGSIDAASTGLGTVGVGEAVKIIVKLNDGYQFVKWDDDNTDNPRLFMAVKDKALVATLKAIEA